MKIDPAASGPDTHLDPDRMADLFDGLLEPDSAEAARGHLASCRRCADDFALITMDSGLAELLGPEPIPMEVAIRIEAALHREPPLSVASAPSATSAGPQHAVAPRRPRRLRLMFGALAGASLVAAGVFGGIVALSSGGAGSKSAVSTAAGGSSYSSRDNSLQHDDNSKAAGAEPNATAPSSAPALAPEASSQSIRDQAEQLLRKSGQTPQAASGSGSGESKAQSAPFQCPPDGFQGVAPLGMAAVTYQGQPAELVAYPKPGDPVTATVYVVATTGCTASVPGHVLYTTEVPRP